VELKLYPDIGHVDTVAAMSGLPGGGGAHLLAPTCCAWLDSH